MPFTLTREHVLSIVSPTEHGEWTSFLDAIDPNVHWLVVDPVHNPESLSGTYTVQTWKEKIGSPLRTKLVDGVIKMKIDELDIIGNKAIVESSGIATQKNGKSYNNRWAWFLIFSEGTGKIVEIREYMNSALTKEVMTTN